MCAIRFPRCWFFFSLLLLLFSFLIPFKEVLFFSEVCVGFKQWKAINPVNFMGFLKWVTLVLFHCFCLVYSFKSFFFCFFGFKINRKLELSPWPKKITRKCHCPCLLSRFIFYLLDPKALMHIKNTPLSHLKETLL